VIVLLDAGTKQLLGKPIGNFLDDPNNAFDTAVTCALDEYLPDPIFMNETIIMEREESGMEISDDE